MTEAAESQSGALETVEDAGQGPSGVYKRWMLEIELSSKTEANWRKAAKDVNARYRDEKQDLSGGNHSIQGSRYSGSNRFNILYSNIQTICPALFNQSPKPDVRRRHRDDDPIGKVIADIQERGLSYTMDEYDFDRYMRLSIKDSQLTGRGVTRVKYNPSFEEKTDDSGNEFEEKTSENVDWEHVNWADFRRGPGLIWEDCDWIAFKHTLSKDEGMEKFPETFADVQMDYSPSGINDDEMGDPIIDSFKRAVVWEVWCKSEGKVIFIAPSLKERPLQTMDDPLGLSHFFPIPRPLYATENTDDLTPVEPFRFYRDQADELDEITKRISGVIKMCKVRGIYDSTIAEMSTLMSSNDGALQPATDVLPLMQAGGLDRAIWMWPIEKIVPVLVHLYQQREAIKTTIYEITGIADIMRGSSAASETLGAQQLKAQFGTMRLDDMRREVQRYARDLVRMAGEIMAEHFSPETMAAMTDVKLLSKEEKISYSIAIRNKQSVSEEIQEAMKLPTWGEVLQILRDDKQRSYRVDIETDSTIAGDQAADQKAITELLTGISSFIQNAGPAVAAGYLPLEAAKSILMTAVRRFKMGREVEDALDMIGEEQEGEEQAPDPEKMQMQQQLQEMQGQLQQLLQENQTMKADKSGEQAKLALDAKKAESDAGLKSRDIALKEFEAQKPLQDETAKYQFESQMAREQMAFDANEADKDRQVDLAKAIMTSHNEEDINQEQAMDSAAVMMQQITAALTAPRRVIYDETGEIVIGSEVSLDG